MDDRKPWFVLITGPMQWQIKPYAWQGWLIMFIWMLALGGVMSLLFIEEIRERWWIVSIAALALTAAIILIGARLAVPIEDLRAPDGSARRSGRRRSG